MQHKHTVHVEVGTHTRTEDLLVQGEHFFYHAELFQ